MTQHYTHVNEAAALRIAGALDLTDQEQEIEEEPKAEEVPPWILEKLREAVEQNNMQIIEELIGDAE